MRIAVFCLFGVFLAGCQTAPVHKPVVAEKARFFLEASDDAGEVVSLPQSEVKITVQPKPVFTEYDIVRVEMTKVELGQCLVFQFSTAASRDLLRLTTANVGRRLVLTLGGVAFGARLIDAPLKHGTLFIFVETPDAALPALVDSLNETSAALQSAGAKR